VKGRSGPRPRKRAVAYVRIPAGQEEHSAVGQMEIIREYARRRGLTIVREYRDGSGSGSNAGGPGLG
jgi:hypothetical protein